MKFRSIKKAAAYLSILLIPMGVFAESTRISDENAPFFYEANAEIKIPDHKLAQYISSDYRNARDEFTRHDLFQQIKPVIDKRLSKAKKTKAVLLRIGTDLGDYNFDKKSFSTGIGATTYIPFDNGYAVTFTNGEKIQFLPVPMDLARTLSGELRRDRSATFTIYGQVVGTKEEELGWKTKKAIKIKITKIEAILGSGTKIGSKKL